MWMHHTWGPKFCSGTKGYDYNTQPNKLPAMARYPKLKGEGAFRNREKAFKMILKPLFF
jgi:hypothetical protein